jgi:tagaturonate reductase
MMKNLNKDLIATIEAKENLFLPGADQFFLPEKVLQFGTGVLLRGLPDQYIQDANNKGLFNGRIVVVKSTASAGMEEFNEQDCLYTVWFRGIREGQLVEEFRINNSISRVLSAGSDWSQVLSLSTSEDLEIVTSNTTEVGMIYQEELILENIPQSFPGRLLKILYTRFLHFKGDKSKGLVIIPAELIEHNADVLKEVLLRLSTFNNLSAEFEDWLLHANFFCNTLVDRIVPGKLNVADQQKAEAFLGYSDKLMIMAEPFGLWAIESAEPRVMEVLSFCDDAAGCKLVPSIEKFKELKLRLLNASHSFSCGVSMLAALDYVRDSMQHSLVSAYIKRLALEEIAASIQGESITPEEANLFARNVLDRFSNPYLQHQWKSIAAQFALKMKVRCIPLIKQYAERYKKLPEGMLIGLAAFMVFEGIPIEDIETVITDEIKWGIDLSQIDGLKHELIQLVSSLSENKIVSVLEHYTAGV